MKRRPLKTKLGGNEFVIRFTSKLHGTVHGECDQEGGIIRINSATPNDQVPEIVIHECLHAIFPFLDEDCVDSAAIELAKVLFKLGLINTPDEI
jgi:hypothetical protein